MQEGKPYLQLPEYAAPVAPLCTSYPKESPSCCITYHTPLLPTPLPSTGPSYFLRVPGSDSMLQRAPDLSIDRVWRKRNCVLMASKISLLAGEGILLRFLMIHALNQGTNMGEGRDDLCLLSAQANQQLCFCFQFHCLVKENLSGSTQKQVLAFHGVVNFIFPVFFLRHFT